jgi:hypothetical protein
MAKYLGLLTADARGKVGGVILSRAQGATTLKSHRTPKRPSSAAQQRHQGAMASAISGWRLLNSAQQQSWVSFAAGVFYTNSLGTTYSPTGQQLYTQAWINSGFNEATPPGTMPIDTVLPPSIATLAISWNPPNLIVTARTISGLYSGDWLLYASSVISPSVNYVRTRSMRCLGMMNGAYSYNVLSAYQAAYGQYPPLGSRVALKGLPVDGASYISGASLIVTATVTT